MEEIYMLKYHSFSFTLWPLYPRVEIPYTHVIGGLLSLCVPFRQDRNLFRVPGIEPRSGSFSPQLSHYTDYAITTPCNECVHLILT